MVRVYQQYFYDKHTGEKHDVLIGFGWISPVSNGEYRLFVDGEVVKTAKRYHKNKLLYEGVVELIRENNWSPLNRA